MNDFVQNKIVEQKDIIKIVDIINNFYNEKMEIFNKTKAEIEAEQEAYSEWNKKKYESANFADYPPFEYKTHTNKFTYGHLSFSFYCIDGLTYEDKSYAEAQNIMSNGYSQYEKISISLDLSWNKTYNQNDFSYSDKNNSNVGLHLTFYEDDIYISYSSKDADSDVRYLKSEISDVFDSLQPKYTKLISKRESIKYNSTLWISSIFSAIIACLTPFAVDKLGMTITFQWLPLIVYIVLIPFINMIVPSTSLSKLYKQIVQNKKTVYEDRELKKVDNV